MSLKTKLTSLIISFVLLASLLVVGVFAVKQTNFGLGGSIVFNAKGVEAKIELVSTNATFLEGQSTSTKMQEVTIDSSMSDPSEATNADTWEDVKLSFNEAGDDVTLQIKITNMYEAPSPADVTKNNYLDITGLTDGNTIKNAKVKVVNTTIGSENGITALLAPGEHATFTVTFSVKDKGTDASIEGQLVNFDLKNLPYADVLEYTAVEGLSFTCDTSAKTAIVTGQSITGSNIELTIPSYVRNGEVICAVTATKEASYPPEGLFYGNTSIIKVNMPNTLKRIGLGTFLECSNLSNIVIPESVTSIGTASFSKSGLISIVIPSSLSTIESRAFNACKNLVSVKILEGVTSIGDGAFVDCDVLASIEIPNSVTSIGDNSFADCNGLTSITIPDSVTSIGTAAFSGCSELTSVTIGNSVTSIGDQVFMHCSGLTSIEIPSSVTSIGQGAFGACSGLTSITIPSSVTSIEGGAFSGCSALKDVYYTGSEEQWGNITIEIENNKLTGATIHYNSTGV